MGFGELLLRDAEHGLTKESATTPITTILTAAEDAAKIVDRLREFYRPDASGDPRIPVDLNTLVEQAISLTQPRWQTEAMAAGQAITLTTQLDDIPPVAGSPAELREVLTNLIFNAVDALPHGGTVTVQTMAEGEQVVLTITDSGTGMSEEVRKRCMEPFFTTKGKRGTGLGLSMAFGIIQRHHGSIEIRSELGRGTAFALRLPVATTTTTATLDAEVSTGGRLRVLVVDDHPILCQLVCEYLRDDLHIFEIALSGQAALNVFRVGKFDVIITDQVMAGMTGEQLAIAIKEIEPRIPVILLTGYVGHSTATEEFSWAIDLVLGKPLSRATLRQALAAATAPVSNGQSEV
jgi:CheY-like chemotaxis protein